jgi:hypothetical protein
MRPPGSHNSWKPVEVIHAPVDAEGRLKRFELSDIEDWLGEQSPVILRKMRPRAITAGETDYYPFCPYYRRYRMHGCCTRSR